MILLRLSSRDRALEYCGAERRWFYILWGWTAELSLPECRFEISLDDSFNDEAGVVEILDFAPTH